MQVIAGMFDSERDIFVTTLTTVLLFGYVASLLRARYELKKYVKYISLHKHLEAVLKLSFLPVGFGFVYALAVKSVDAFTVTLMSSFIVTGFVLVVADKVASYPRRIDFIRQSAAKAFLINTVCLAGLIVYYVLLIELFGFNGRSQAEIMTLGVATLIVVFFVTVFVTVRIWLTYATYTTPSELRER